MPAKLLLDRRNQLVLNRVAIRPHVGRVHRIGIVIVRIRMLNLHDQHTRKFRARSTADRTCTPPAAESGCIRQGESGRCNRVSGSGSGGVVRKSSKSRHKVVVKDHQRKTGIGMLVKPFRHQHNCAHKHWSAPELRQRRALDVGCAGCISCLPASRIGGITSFITTVMRRAARLRRESSAASSRDCPAKDSNAGPLPGPCAASLSCHPLR